jgi:prevent-host-death family protein
MAVQVSATEARVHFGEILRKLESDVDVVIEKNGVRVGVLVSPRRFNEVFEPAPSGDWSDRTRQTREAVARWLNGSPLPDIDEIVNAGHEDE